MEFKIEKTPDMDKVRFSLWVTRHEAMKLQTSAWYMFTTLWKEMAKTDKVSDKLRCLASMVEFLERREYWESKEEVPKDGGA